METETEMEMEMEMEMQTRSAVLARCTSALEVAVSFEFYYH